jgi:hypothetical protein
MKVEYNNLFINENKFCQGKFKWQDTCSAFSVSKVDVGKDNQSQIL